MAGGLKWVSLAVLGLIVVIGGGVALLGGKGDAHALLLNSWFKFSLSPFSHFIYFFSLF